MRTIAFAAAACAFAMAGCRSPAAHHEPQTFHIEMRGMQYVPASLNVHRGDVVIWTNRDLVPHTATSAGWFDSGSIAPGDSWTYVIREPVELDYLCSFHPTMKGQLFGEK